MVGISTSQVIVIITGILIVLVSLLIFVFFMMRRYIPQYDKMSTDYGQDTHILVKDEDSDVEEEDHVNIVEVVHAVQHV